MEILSQEMERSEREEGEGEGDGGLDYDSLDDFDLSGSAAYRDFRAPCRAPREGGTCSRTNAVGIAHGDMVPRTRLAGSTTIGWSWIATTSTSTY